MTFPPNYHDPFAAGIPPEVAAIEEYCGMPIEEAAEKYCGPPVLCPGGHYVAFAHPPGCGREHFRAVAEVYRLMFERQARARNARAALRLDATPAKSSREPPPSPPPDGLLTPAVAYLHKMVWVHGRIPC